MRLISPPRRGGHSPAYPAPADPGSRQARRVRGLRRLLTIGAALALLVLVAQPAHAEPAWMLSAEDSLEDVLDNIRNWIMGIAATLATVMLSVGGVIRMMAGGDPGEVERSNRAFKSAGWGYGIATLAPLAVEILKGIVGE